MEPPVDIVDRHRKADVIEVDSDICDACPAAAKVAAYVYAELTSGPISLCGHHGTEALPKLQQLGAHIVDLRHLIGR